MKTKYRREYELEEIYRRAKDWIEGGEKCKIRELKEKGYYLIVTL